MRPCGEIYCRRFDGTGIWWVEPYSKIIILLKILSSEMDQAEIKGSFAEVFRNIRPSSIL
jgi:hypothetical protein